MTPTEAAVRTRLADYLAGRCTLAAFWDWFAPATWAVCGREVNALSGLVYAVKLRVAEYTRGHRTEADLRARLGDCLAPPHRPEER